MFPFLAVVEASGLRGWWHRLTSSPPGSHIRPSIGFLTTGACVRSSVPYEQASATRRRLRHDQSRRGRCGLLGLRTAAPSLQSSPRSRGLRRGLRRAAGVQPSATTVWRTAVSRAAAPAATAAAASSLHPTDVSTDRMAALCASRAAAAGV